MKISDRVGSMTYAIRDVQQVANQLKEEGHDILYFNIGDPNKFDFDVPQTMRDKLAEVANQRSGYYSESIGDLYVRERIAWYEDAKYHNGVQPSDVIFTNGVSEGILYLFLSFLNPGDRVLVPGPTYPAYQSAGTVTQAETVAYRCIEEEGWIPDINDLRSKITDRTRLIIVINPNNPTGSVYSEGVLKQIIDLAGEYDLAVVSDEIYDRQILDEEVKYTSMSTLAKDVPLIVFNGFSKNYLAPGWRAAYTYKIDQEDRIDEPFEGIRKMCRTRLSPTTPISLASIAGLDLNPPHLKPMLKKIKERRDLVVKGFNEIERIETFVPQAAFYIFPKVDLSGTSWKSDRDFVLDLLREQQTLLVHGSGFSKDYGYDHFRMVYLSTPEILKEGVRRISEFLSSPK